MARVTQLLDPIVPGKYRYDVPLRIEKHASKIKYGILGAVVLYFLATRDMSIYRYVEPFWLFGGQASTGLWIALGVMLFATIFVRILTAGSCARWARRWAALSKVTIFGIKRWSECNSCKICEKTRQWGAIGRPKIIMTERVRRDDCERLYMDHAEVSSLDHHPQEERGPGAPVGGAAGGPAIRSASLDSAQPRRKNRCSSPVARKASVRPRRGC